MLEILRVECRALPPNRTSLVNLAITVVVVASLTACQRLESPSQTASSTPRESVSSAGESWTAEPIPPAEVTEQAGLSIPPTSNFIEDDFESGSLSKWGEISEPNLSLAARQGHNASTGLSVIVHKRETYLYKTAIKQSTEGYVTFWFNPNGVDIPDHPDVKIPGKSIRIVDVKGYQHYDVVAGLRIWRPQGTGQGYKAYLEWKSGDGQHFDLSSGQFDLPNAWAKITLGFRINQWVAVWVNDALMRQVTGVRHSESFGENLELGKANDDSVAIPKGVMYYDEVAYQIPRLTDLWVDAVNGSDTNDGLQVGAAFQTIQKAAGLAGPGTTIHILPGIYRESVRPAADGTAAEPVVFKAEGGQGTVIIRGSESSNSLSWHTLESKTIGLPASVDPTQIYYADLSGWKLEGTPRFVVRLDEQGNVAARLPLAREPDWTVGKEWKYQEFWWSADGGSSKAGCDPATDANPDCDLASRSSTMLTDSTDDTGPPGIEPGNLSTLGDLTGATLTALDTQEGHYVYRRTIVAHDVSAGRITLDRKCGFDSPENPGLGWGTKYYVEGKASLLDAPGEWWYDSGSRLLYIWPPAATSPANLHIEISRLETGFDLSHRSNITLEGVTLEFFNGSAVYGANDSGQKSYGNTVRDVSMQYDNRGVTLSQEVGGQGGNITSHFTLENSELAHMDTHAIKLSYAWKDESAPASFTFPGITDTEIRGNELHDLGFRSDQDNAIGVSFQYADHLRFEGNHVYDVAHNGVQFSWSVIHSDKAYGFSPDEIKTGDILVKDNVFERACQLTSDCGGLKFWGDPPDGHVYRNVLITGNVFRNTFGWTWVSEQRGRWNGGAGSAVRGMGGFGLYLDMVSGFHVYRNIAYNNAFAGIDVNGVWRDGEMLFYNNVTANSLYGIRIAGLEFNTHAAVNSQIVNNMLVNNEGAGLWLTDSGEFPGGMTIDYNLYSGNGWRLSSQGDLPDAGALVIRRAQAAYEGYPTLTDIRSKTAWEAHGLEGDPGFAQYDPSDHDLFDGSWPDFHIGTASGAVDRGSEGLPASLTSLLNEFGVQDERIGPAYDIGRYEYASN